jgi:hypothetical protein
VSTADLKPGTYLLINELGQAQRFVKQP